MSAQVGTTLYPVCDEWLSALQVVGTVIAAAAAVWALKQARDTVRETRAMRREERLARLPGLIGNLAEALRKAYGSYYDPTTHSWLDAHAAREELRGAIAVSGEDLPACRALVAAPLFPSNEEERNRPGFLDQLRAAVTAAIDEVIAVFPASRPRAREFPPD